MGAPRFMPLLSKEPGKLARAMTARVGWLGLQQNRFHALLVWSALRGALDSWVRLKDAAEAVAPVAEAAAPTAGAAPAPLTDILDDSNLCVTLFSANSLLRTSKATWHGEGRGAENNFNESHLHI